MQGIGGWLVRNRGIGYYNGEERKGRRFSGFSKMKDIRIGNSAKRGEGEGVLPSCANLQWRGIFGEFCTKGNMR